ELFRDGPFQLDRQVADAAARIQDVGRDEGVCRTGVEAASAGAAASFRRAVGRQWEVEHNLPQKEPRAAPRVYQHCVFAEPAQTCFLRNLPLEERAGVDVDAAFGG